MSDAIAERARRNSRDFVNAVAWAAARDVPIPPDDYVVLMNGFGYAEWLRGMGFYGPCEATMRGLWASLPAEVRAAAPRSIDV